MKVYHKKRNNQYIIFSTEMVSILPNFPKGPVFRNFYMDIAHIKKNGFKEIDKIRDPEVIKHLKPLEILELKKHGYV